MEINENNKLKNNTKNKNTKKLRTTLRIKKDGKLIKSDDIIQVPLSINEGADDDSILDPSFKAVMEEEEDFPDYEKRGDTILRDGEEVDYHQLMDDYQKLKTEIRQMEKVAHTLYRNTQMTEEMAAKTIYQERKKGKSLALKIAVFLIFIGLIAIGSIYFIKEQKAKEILDIAKKEREEKNRITKLMKDSERQKEKVLDSIKDSHEVEKKRIKNELEREKQIALEKLKTEFLQKKIGEGLSDRQKQEILAKMKENLEEKFKEKEFNKIEELKVEMQKERKIYVDKINNLLKKIEDKSKTIKEDPKSIKEAKDRLLYTKEIKKEFEKKLKNMEKRIKKQMEEEKKLAINNKTKEENKTYKPKEENKTYKPKEENKTYDSKIYENKKTTVNAREIVEDYYYQKLVKTEKVDVLISQGNFRYLLKAYSFNNKQENINKMLIRLVKPRRLKDYGYLAIYNKNTYQRKSWVFDPTDKKLIRVTSSMKDEKILDTDVTYKYLEIENLEDYKYSYIKTVKLKNRSTHIILYEPKDKVKNTRKYFWFDATTHFPLQIKSFDKKGDLEGIFFVTNYVMVSGVHLRPYSAIIIKTKSRTRISIYFKNWEINKNIPEDFFTLRYLSNR